MFPNKLVEKEGLPSARPSKGKPYLLILHWTPVAVTTRSDERVITTPCFSSMSPLRRSSSFNASGSNCHYKERWSKNPESSFVCRSLPLRYRALCCRSLHISLDLPFSTYCSRRGGRDFDYSHSQARDRKNAMAAGAAV